MIARQWALLQRELWEHRAIYIAPLALALIMILLSVTGQVVVSAFDQAVDLAILGASNLGERERAAAISVFSTATTSLFALETAILAIFYLLDTLYTERRDKSILFWRSLPISDAETVVSKLLTAIVLIPLISVVIAIFTHLVILGISSLWVDDRGGDAWNLIWTAAPILENSLATLIVFLALPLWFLPFVGWFMFVSAWTRRSPFLVAFLPLLVVPMLERILIGTTLLRDAIFVRSAQLPLFSRKHGMEVIFSDAEDFALSSGANVTLLGFIDVGRFMADPRLWAGLVVGGLFIAAAVYMRRYRDDS